MANKHPPNSQTYLFILNNCRPDILNVNNANFLKYTCSTETGNAALPRLFQMIHSKKPISNASLNSVLLMAR